MAWPNFLSRVGRRFLPFGGTRSGRSVFDLDRPLLQWSRHDALTVRQLLAGGVLVTGRTGSGKTTGPGRHLAERLLAEPSIGGCVLGAKPAEDLATWQALAAKANRPLHVIGPGHGLSVNVLDYLAKHVPGGRPVVSFLRGVAETLHRSGQGHSSENGAFFESGEDAMLLHAVVAVKLGLGRLTGTDLARFIRGHADAPETLRDPDWQADFHVRVLRQADANARTAAERHDLKNAEEYWLGEVPRMPDRTRGCIEMGVMQTLNSFNTAIVQEVLGSDAGNFDLDDVVEGRSWLFVDASPLAYGPEGSCISNALKAALQLRIMQRTPSEESGVCAVWADEAQLFATRRLDPAFAAVCRSRKGFLVYLTQGIASLREAFGGDSGREAVKVLTGNFGHHVACALGSFEDAEELSNLIGRRPKVRFGGSLAPTTSIADVLFGDDGFTASFSETLEPILEPRVFLSGLRTGGRRNSNCVDAVVVRTGDCFASGENHLFTTFHQ